MNILFIRTVKNILCFEKSPCLPISNSPALSAKGGQALVEFLVGLIAFLAIAACLRIGSIMISSHSDAMTTARNNAASAASQDADVLSDARYIHERTAGKDEIWFREHNIPVQGQYTKDDDATTANGSEFSSLIVNKAVSADSDWDIINQIPNNRLSKLRDQVVNPSSSFGLVLGSDKRTVPIDEVPAVRLFYDAKTIEVECNVWMTQLNGIY